MKGPEPAELPHDDRPESQLPSVPLAVKHPPSQSGSQRLRFASVLVFTKREAFELCEACADAERALLRNGRPIEAARMAAVFELIESRLVLAGA